MSRRVPLAMLHALSTARETAEFAMADLFFSRTDRRGVIQSGNDTFQRISGFEWQDLLGAPHRVVRHPGMPKGVFFMLWAALKQERPIGAYVVNQTQDGQAYTVFAVIMPVEDGYLSVRFKPSTDHAVRVKALYDAVTACEKDGSISAEESAARLMEGIRDMGFPDYDAFMSGVLVDEMTARNTHLSRHKLVRLQSLSRVEQGLACLQVEAQSVRALFAASSQIPHNLRLQAARLEGREGPISVISSNHQRTSDAFEASLGAFLEASTLGAAPLREASFLMATAKLMTEVVETLDPPGPQSHARQTEDRSHLVSLAAQYVDRATRAVSDVRRQTDFFERALQDMQRMVFGLELTRTMCSIEQSRATGDTSGLDEIVDKLKQAEMQLSAIMTRISHAVSDMMDGAERLSRSAPLCVVSGQATETAA